MNKTIFLIPSDDKSLLGLLNSKVIWFYLMNVCTSLGDPKEGGRLNLQKVYLETTPIIDITNKDELRKSVSNQLIANSNFQALNGNFIKLLSNKYSITTFSSKLKQWSELEFGDFFKELEKARKKTSEENGAVYKKLSLSEESEWMHYFTEQKENAQFIKSQIESADQKIDRMLYKLYGLTEEEIKIVEEATA